MFTVWKMVMRF